MLEIVLNAARPLPDEWYADYGMTTERNDTLLAPFPESNSFKHPDSETALTLFMLGNLDGWKQLGHFNEYGPRSRNGKWNRAFFSSVRNAGIQGCPERGLWSRLNDGIFCDNTLNWSDGLLMFEFEVMNSAFHSIDGKAFKELSFLNIANNRKWGAFDAFMAVPSTRPTEQRRGTLVGFEAKLRSDISRHTKHFDFVNQIMRNLEAGYWLTHRNGSLYRNWEFHYVFICPRLDYELKSTYYSWMLSDVASRQQAVDKYQAVLEHHGAAPDQQHFDAFRQMVSENITVLHWDHLENAIRQGNDNFFQEYLQLLGRLPDSAEVLGATSQRFKYAGIQVK